MFKFNSEDFNVVISEPNGEFVRISELNDMIWNRAIIIDIEKLENYKRNTRTTKIIFFDEGRGRF